MFSENIQFSPKNHHANNWMLKYAVFQSNSGDVAQIKQCMTHGMCESQAKKQVSKCLAFDKWSKVAGGKSGCTAFF